MEEESLQSRIGQKLDLIALILSQPNHRQTAGMVTGQDRMEDSPWIGKFEVIAQILREIAELEIYRDLERELAAQGK